MRCHRFASFTTLVSLGVTLASTRQTAAADPTSVVYLNACIGGCQTTKAGTPDARTNQFAEAWSLAAASLTADQLTQVATCVQGKFAGLGVNITTTDPGNVAHIEIMLGGDPTTLGFDANTVTYAYNNCGGVLDAPIAVVFANGQAFANSKVSRLCHWASNAIGSSAGLSPKSDTRDIMYKGTSPVDPSTSAFVDASLGCYGGACTCGGGSSENSWQTLLAYFSAAGGGAPDPQPQDPTDPQTPDSGTGDDGGAGDNGDSAASPEDQESSGCQASAPPTALGALIVLAIACSLARRRRA